MYPTLPICCLIRLKIKRTAISNNRCIGVGINIKFGNNNSDPINNKKMLNAKGKITLI